MTSLGYIRVDHYWARSCVYKRLLRQGKYSFYGMHAIVNDITYMVAVNTLCGMCRELALWRNMSHELLDEDESTFIKFIQIYLKVANNAVYHYEVF